MAKTDFPAIRGTEYAINLERLPLADYASRRARFLRLEPRHGCMGLTMQEATDLVAFVFNSGLDRAVIMRPGAA